MAQTQGKLTFHSCKSPNGHFWMTSINQYFSNPGSFSLWLCYHPGPHCHLHLAARRRLGGATLWKLWFRNAIIYVFHWLELSLCHTKLQRMLGNVVYCAPWGKRTRMWWAYGSLCHRCYLGKEERTLMSKWLLFGERRGNTCVHVVNLKTVQENGHGL